MMPAVSSAVPDAAPSAKPSFYRPELDMLRFFAFLVVFMAHTVWFPRGILCSATCRCRPPRFWPASCAAALSGGFVLCVERLPDHRAVRSEKEEPGSLDVKSFYVRRILRIWPLYYFFVTLGIFIPFLNPGHGFSLGIHPAIPAAGRDLEHCFSQGRSTRRSRPSGAFRLKSNFMYCRRRLWKLSLRK